MNNRRTFLNHLLAAGGVAAAAAPVAQAQTGQGGRASEFSFLPRYARAQNYKSLKQSSYDRTGGNRDSWNIRGGRHATRCSTPKGPASSPTSGSPSPRAAATI